MHPIASANTAVSVAKGAAGYSAQIASFIASSVNAVRMGFTTSFSGAARTLISSNCTDEFIHTLVHGGGWKGVAAAGLISIPTAVMNLTNFFDDGRRIREIASGQSNFYTDRSAAAKSWGLSALGLGSSVVLGVSGAMMGAGAGTGIGKALTIGSGVVATGSLVARNLYKYFTIDLPTKSNAGLGLISMNRPVFRVDDPSSPYYMMNHMMEKTVRNRQIQDATSGELGSEYAKKLENLGLSVTNYLTA